MKIWLRVVLTIHVMQILDEQGYSFTATAQREMRLASLWIAMPTRRASQGILARTRTTNLRMAERFFVVP